MVANPAEFLALFTVNLTECVGRAGHTLATHPPPLLLALVSLVNSPAGYSSLLAADGETEAGFLACALIAWVSSGSAGTVSGGSCLPGS